MSLAGPDGEDQDALERGGLSLFGGEEAELATVAWAENAPNMLDHLGNEFLVWLWHTLQNDSDTIPLADGSEVAVMLAKTLTLDCPRGETGRDSLTDDAPTRLPEAFRALQSGKLPAQGRPDPRPPRRPVRADPPGRDPRRLGRRASQTRGRRPLRPRRQDRPDRQPPPPDRDPRPPLRRLPPPPRRARAGRRKSTGSSGG